MCKYIYMHMVTQILTFPHFRFFPNDLLRHMRKKKAPSVHFIASTSHPPQLQGMGTTFLIYILHGILTSQKNRHDFTLFLYPPFFFGALNKPVRTSMGVKEPLLASAPESWRKPYGFHGNTGGLVGIFMMVYYNLHINWVVCHPL